MYTLDQAIELALRTWYPKSHQLHLSPHHPMGKLLGEWGELLDDYMKSQYKPNYQFDPTDELGDIWYYIRILLYQNVVYPHITDYIRVRYLGVELKVSIAPVNRLIASAIYQISEVVLLEGESIDHCDFYTPESLLSMQYSTLKAIANRYGLTINDLTEANWNKLKPGSERGEQWMQARKGK